MDSGRGPPPDGRPSHSVRRVRLKCSAMRGCVIVPTSSAGVPAGFWPARPPYVRFLSEINVHFLS